MIILSTYTINVQRHSRILRKALHTMWDHLAAQIANLLTLETQLDDGVWAIGEVDYCAGEGFIEGGVGGSEACEACRCTEGIFERATKSETDVFCCVMIIDWEVNRQCSSLSTREVAYCEDPLCN